MIRFLSSLTGFCFYTLFYSFFTSSFAFSFSFDSNVPIELQNQISEDLKFVSEIIGETQSQLHQKIFGELSGRNYSHFFHSRISKIGIDPNQNKAGMASINPDDNASKILIHTNYFKFDHPQIARLMILFHEARHSELDSLYWFHHPCPHSLLKSIWTGAFLANRNLCDSTAFGSIGISVIMLKNISRYCLNCSDKTKKEANAYADHELTKIVSEDARNLILND